MTRKALRLYEQLGLVRPLRRTEAGYRLYDEEALRRLRLVIRAKSLGLTLAEAEGFMVAAETCCGDNQDELTGIVQRKLTETEGRLEEMSVLRESLRGELDRLERQRIEP